ncbi:MAG: hypothetical protein M9894_36415 [Planctomycetes bacterium]|nr:hypothetical protein [Planctomycetota bacterium]
MTFRVATTSLLAALALALPAAADEPTTYDLRAGDDYTPVVGDVLRVETTERQKSQVVVKSGEQVLQEQEGQQGQSAVYTEEVLAVDDQGQVSRARRVYESFRDLEAGAAPDVSGLVVLLERGDDGKHAFVPEGEAQVPPELEERLAQEGLQRDAKKALGDQEKERQHALLPDEPVPVGATWEVTPEQALVAFGFQDSALHPELTTVRGTFRSLEERDGVTFMNVHVDVDLAFTRFQGLDCPEPASFKLQLDLLLPEGGTSPAGEARLTGVFDGEPVVPEAPGVTMAVDLELENAQRRTRVGG